MRVLSDGLKKNFTDVTVSVVDCPDLMKKPFMLASSGLCGNARLADVGGPGFLLPLPKKDKKFSYSQIAESVGLPGAFMIGAGAGPCHIVGVNSELINNVQMDGKGGVAKINSHIAKVNPQDGGCILETIDKPEFSLMGNFLCCDGQPGKVLEVKAKKRVGEENFMSSLRKTLKAHYGENPVALGGVFLVEKGKANLHIMPEFSDKPLDSQEKVDSWLKYYEMDAILVCVGELVSHDPGFDLRVEHFHCFSDHGQGGHYHYDVTPADVEYRGYFVLADSIYRIDQPGK
ncbi:ester hydrolase C11orf54 homolog isoform X2 [Ostrea edulis]|uniref:ester hydrolase C11orf54 homolog isoform X2 n=1 Tax=Ostrea edulis TaxID=37623 RepID=UPI0024AEB98B|nr:ester hydrolase C11orf54 homolog isoform X2 [Ostrea edulis]